MAQQMVLSFLNEVAKRDKRVIVIHQENKGESSARNGALEKATGEYNYRETA